MNKPWELNPDLEEEKLIEVASLIAEVRSEVVELHDEELGDTNQSLGFRAYECCRSRIAQAATESTYLKILTYEGRFTFAIGNTPVRFFRGVPTNIEERRLIKSIEAASQLSLLEVTFDIADINWWFAVEVDEFKLADKVSFVGFDSIGQQVCLWEVPLQDTIPLLHSVDLIAKPPAVRQDKPKPKLKVAASKKKVNDEKD